MLVAIIFQNLNHLSKIIHEKCGYRYSEKHNNRAKNSLSVAFWVKVSEANGCKRCEEEVSEGNGRLLRLDIFKLEFLNEKCLFWVGTLALFEIIERVLTEDEPNRACKKTQEIYDNNESNRFYNLNKQQHLSQLCVVIELALGFLRILCEFLSSLLLESLELFFVLQVVEHAQTVEEPDRLNNENLLAHPLRQSALKNSAKGKNGKDVKKKGAFKLLGARFLDSPSSFVFLVLVK